jgi:hypothetical protein
MNTPKANKMKASVVEETDLGLYVWHTGQGILMNEDKDILSIPSKKHDREKIKIITEAAHDAMRNNGLEPSGQPVFLAGHRQITDEEHEEQVQRQKWGLIPDPYDVAAMEEEIRHGGKFK